MTLDDYKDLEEAANRSQRDVEELIAQIVLAATTLSAWKTIGFVGITADAKEIRSTSSDASDTININQKLPTMLEIYQAKERWVLAQKTLQNAQLTQLAQPATQLRTHSPKHG